MEYKNNYQRKQAIWREKWLKKVEERKRVKALYQPIIDAGISLREAFALTADAIVEIANQISAGIAELLENPELREELNKLQNI